jgi:hypothetical protein
MYSSKLQLESKFLVQVIEIAKIMQMNNILEGLAAANTLECA